MSKTNTVLFFSRDPGGTNQLIALHAFIQAAQSNDPLSLAPSVRGFIADTFDDATKLVIAAKDTAVDFWRKAGVADVDIEDWSTLSTDECSKRMTRLDPSHLITATTDVDDRTDLALWQAARDKAIPSTAFTDHRINLMRRFTDKNERIVFPDCVFVINEEGRGILIEGGLPQNNVVVGEDLHINLLKQQPKHNGTDRQAVRELWTVAANETVVLFLSENTHEMSAAGRLGNYNEFECLGYTIKELSKPQTDFGGRTAFALSNATLVIRPHPKDTPGKYDAYAQHAYPKVIVSSEGDGTSAVAASDVVVGMRSSLFEEAAVMNVPVVSLVDGYS